MKVQRRNRKARQVKAVTEHLQGQSKPTAMKRAGYAESYAEGHSQDFFDRPPVRSLMTKALQKASPTIIDEAAACVRDALKAERVFVIPQGRDAPATVKREPDHDVRLKGVDRVTGAFGFIATKMEMPAPPRPPINITFIIKSGGGRSRPQTIVDLKTEMARPKSKPFSITIKRPATPVPAGR